MLNKFLYTFGIPDPDILIRTGDMQIKQFFTMAISLYRTFFVKKMWPDFTKNDYKKVLSKFKKTRKFWQYIMDKEFQKR